MRTFCPSLEATCAKNVFFARINALAGDVYVGNPQQPSVKLLSNKQKTPAVGPGRLACFAGIGCFSGAVDI